MRPKKIVCAVIAGIVMLVSGLLFAAEEGGLLFQTDFSSGYRAQMRLTSWNAAGELKPVEGTAEGVQTIDGKTGKAVRISSTMTPGPYLCYPAGVSINRFMGVLECRVNFSASSIGQGRHIIIDLRNRGKTGYLLEKKTDGSISLSAQEEGQVLTEIKAPIDRGWADTWHQVTASWNTEKCTLFFDGKKVAESKETVIPSVVGQDIFIGSSYEAVDQVGGSIEGVKIYLKEAKQ